MDKNSVQNSSKMLQQQKYVSNSNAGAYSDPKNPFAVLKAMWKVIKMATIATKMYFRLTKQTKNGVKS